MFEIQIDSLRLHDGLLNLLDFGVKSMVLMLFALVVTSALRSASAAIRHRVWTLAFATLILLPVAAFLPGNLQWKLVSICAADRASKHELLDLTPALSSTENVIESHPLFTDADEPSLAAGWDVPGQGNRLSSMLGYLSWPLILVTVWLLGASFHLGRIVHSWRLLRHLNDESRWVRGGRVERSLEQLRVRLGVRQDVELRVSTGETVPLTWGILHPVVILPGSAVNWCQQQLESVILHELAHIRRRDLAAMYLAHAACALFWINPLTWYGFRKLRVEQEHACDDCVLNVGIRASTYAAHLVNLMERVSTARVVTAVAFSGSSKLESRVRAIIDVRRRRSPVNSGWEAAICGAVGLLSLTFLLVRTGEVAVAQAPAATLQQPKTPQNGQGNPIVPAELTDAQRDDIALANLKAVMAAIHAYCQDHGLNLPPATIPNDTLPPERRLSGLVALLPYLEIDPSAKDQIDHPPGKTPKRASGQALLAKIDLTKAWDDPANAVAAKTLVPQFILPFGAPTRNSDGLFNTHIALVRGSSTVDDGCFPFDPTRTVHIQKGIPDGTSLTMAIGQVHTQVGPWIAGGDTTSRRVAHLRDETKKATFSGPDGAAAYFANADGFPFFLDIGATPQRALSLMASATDRQFVDVPASRYASRAAWRTREK